jgi:hypothetical protein
VAILQFYPDTLTCDYDEQSYLPNSRQIPLPA